MISLNDHLMHILICQYQSQGYQIPQFTPTQKLPKLTKPWYHIYWW